jgi:hypothetical protein
MENRVIVNGWLADLAGKYRLGKTALDGKGVCAFRYRRAMEVTIEVPADASSVFLWSPIKSADVKDPAAFYESLLALNFMTQETQGACFALDRKTRTVILNYTHPIAALDSRKFENLLGAFLETAERHWQRFHDAAPAATQPASHAAGKGNAPEYAAAATSTLVRLRRSSG